MTYSAIDDYYYLLCMYRSYPIDRQSAARSDGLGTVQDPSIQPGHPSLHTIIDDFFSFPDRM